MTNAEDKRDSLPLTAFGKTGTADKKKMKNKRSTMRRKRKGKKKKLSMFKALP